MMDMKIINKIHHADCLEFMKENIPDNSIDALVTDPPYGLSFMGKKWDYEVPSVEIWREVLRVLKPGGFLLSFGGTRTYHRLVVNIEDAGFEIRDMISWLYGSGFPKSLNIGKQIDKILGNERIFTGEIKHHAQKGVKIAEERGEVGGGAFGKAKDEEITKGNSEWEGYGTALKPALEPIVVARKPISEKNIALNVLKWGVGGINIDGCRIGTSGARFNGRNVDSEIYGKYGTSKPKEIYNYGRFPANIILDEIAGKMLDEQSGELKSGKDCKRKKNHQTNAMAGLLNMLDRDEISYGDCGGASRFFYCPKASKSERNYGLKT